MLSLVVITSSHFCDHLMTSHDAAPGHRWATALLLSAMVLAFGGYATGGFSNGKRGTLLAALALSIAPRRFSSPVGVARHERRGS